MSCRDCCCIVDHHGLSRIVGGSQDINVVISPPAPTAPSSTGTAAHTASDHTGSGGCTSTDPLAVLKTFLQAGKEHNEATMAACQDPQHPMFGGAGTEQLAQADLLVDQARRTDGPSTSGLPYRVTFAIPFPDEPREGQPPFASALIVKLALNLSGNYVIDEVQYSVST